MIKKCMMLSLLFCLGAQAILYAETISFINFESEILQGVDGNTSSWSVDRSLVNLGTRNWSLLGGDARIFARGGGNLSHRGDRGLGVWGGENDEIDGYGIRNEALVIKFEKPYYLQSLEVRSLFQEADGIEKARVRLFLGGSALSFYDLVAEQATGTDGIKTLSFDTPIMIDALRFFVPRGTCSSCYSEFALAKLNVTATPEPVSVSLFLLGGGALALRKRFSRRRTA